MLSAGTLTYSEPGTFSSIIFYNIVTCISDWDGVRIGYWIYLSRVLVTETGFGLVIGFINHFTVRNYKQLLITLPLVIQFTIIFYWLQLIQRCRCFNTLWFTVTHTSRLLVCNYITGTSATRRKSFTHTKSLQFTRSDLRLHLNEPSAAVCYRELLITAIVDSYKPLDLTCGKTL
jgi:hypothetical protein